MTANGSSPTNAQPITYAVAFSEPVTDLTAAGVTVGAPAANTGLAKSVSKTDNQHFTVSVSGLQTDGSGDGAITVQVSAAAVTDLAGNTNTASNTASVTWDRSAPAVTLTAPADGSATNNTTPTAERRRRERDRRLRHGHGQDLQRHRHRRHARADDPGHPHRRFLDDGSRSPRAGHLHRSGHPDRHRRQHRHELGEHVHGRHDRAVGDDQSGLRPG